MTRLLAALLLVLPAQDAEVGSAKDPILCDGPGGERQYLSRLRTLDGERMSWTRNGSVGGNLKDKHLLDSYSNGQGGTLLLDMYHPLRVEIRAPQGYRLLTEWSSSYEYVAGKIHAFKDEKPFTGQVRETLKDHTLAVDVKDGVIQGSLLRTYLDGKTKLKAAYNAANLRHGEEAWFHSDGNPWALRRFENGVPHGKCEFWAEDGTLEDSGEFVDGQRKEPERKPE
jgi:hypothetical protein